MERIKSLQDLKTRLTEMFMDVIEYHLQRRSFIREREPVIHRPTNGVAS
jgi:hypothetical protein